MREERRVKREAEIEEAAYELLVERGYQGMSMLAVAKRAQASNETLYKWYGDKTGLVSALVARNAAEVKALLEGAIAAEAPLRATLSQLGPLLLDLVLGDRAVALNQAAAADTTGALGAALSEAGRGTVIPLLVQVFERAHIWGEVGPSDPSESAALYLDVLIGDQQIRRVAGRASKPSSAAIDQRARGALEMTYRLIGRE